MKARLRFWLWALDVAHALRGPRSVYLWLVERASNATDWGPAVERNERNEGPPW
jgi:hypothetical protein